jgi:tetratricopeptide (TPR) repeat protein
MVTVFVALALVLNRSMFAELALSRGELDWRQGNITSAIAFAKRALWIDPQFEPAAIRLIGLEREYNIKASRVDAEKLAPRFVNDIAFNREYGRVVFVQGDYRQSAEMFDKISGETGAISDDVLRAAFSYDNLRERADTCRVLTSGAGRFPHDRRINQERRALCT